MDQNVIIYYVSEYYIREIIAFYDYEPSLTTFLILDFERNTFSQIFLTKTSYNYGARDTAGMLTALKSYINYVNKFDPSERTHKFDILTKDEFERELFLETI